MIGKVEDGSKNELKNGKISRYSKGKIDKDEDKVMLSMFVEAMRI